MRLCYWRHGKLLVNTAVLNVSTSHESFEHYYPGQQVGPTKSSCRYLDHIDLSRTVASWSNKPEFKILKIPFALLWVMEAPAIWCMNLVTSPDCRVTYWSSRITGRLFFGNFLQLFICVSPHTLFILWLPTSKSTLVEVTVVWWSPTTANICVLQSMHVAREVKGRF
jgi:hypothetical protein